MRKNLCLLAVLASFVLACGGDDSSSPDAPNNSIDASFDAMLFDAAPPVSVTGTVTVRDTPVSGATVAIMGTAITDTTNGSGAFEIMVPPGEHYITATSTPDYGSLSRITVPAGGLTGVNLDVIDDADVADVATQLSRTFSETNGIVQIDFNDTAAGGEGATITASSDAAFTFDQNNDAVVSAVIIAGGNTELIFSNVAVGTTGAAVTNGSGTTCALDYPGVTTWPVVARTLTKIPATCN
jgi:hypothetical protein